MPARHIDRGRARTRCRRGDRPNVAAMTNGDADTSEAPEATPWWRDAVIYQIYPRSFAEAAAPGGEQRGIGDLRGSSNASTTSRVARRGRTVVVADLPLADGRLRLRHQRPLRRRPVVRRSSPISTSCSPRPMPEGSASCSTSCPTTPATSTRGSSTAGRAPPPSTPKWYVWRDAPANNWRSALPPGLAGLDARRDDGPVLPALLPPATTRPRLGRAGGRSGDARGVALLARARRRRLPHGRRAPHRQGRRPRRPTEPRLPRATTTSPTTTCHACTDGCGPSAGCSTTTRASR